MFCTACAAELHVGSALGLGHGGKPLRGHACMHVCVKLPRGSAVCAHCKGLPLLCCCAGSVLLAAGRRTAVPHHGGTVVAWLPQCGRCCFRGFTKQGQDVGCCARALQFTCLWCVHIQDGDMFCLFCFVLGCVGFFRGALPSCSACTAVGAVMGAT